MNPGSCFKFSVFVFKLLSPSLCLSLCKEGIAHFIGGARPFSKCRTKGQENRSNGTQAKVVWAHWSKEATTKEWDFFYCWQLYTNFCIQHDEVHLKDNKRFIRALWTSRFSKFLLRWFRTFVTRARTKLTRFSNWSGNWGTSKGRGRVCWTSLKHFSTRRKNNAKSVKN